MYSEEELELLRLPYWEKENRRINLKGWAYRPNSCPKCGHQGTFRSHKKEPQKVSCPFCNTDLTDDGKDLTLVEAIGELIDKDIKDEDELI